MRRDGASDMAVEGRFFLNDEAHVVSVKQIGRTKQIELDGKPVDDRKEIVSNIPGIVFCHDDIAFVTGAPEMQRWFMNQTQSLVEPGFIPELRRYSRILRSRNAALKDRRIELLDVLDQQLVESGLPLQVRRADLAQRFNATLTSLFGFVFGEERELELTYSPSWNEPDDDPEPADPDKPPGLDGRAGAEDLEAASVRLRERLARDRRRDLDLRTSTRGPHRDRFPFRLDGRLLADIGSTGQLRLVSLILRVAQAQLLSRVTGRLPVLLLDDVLLELDPARRARFVEALPEYEQAFFTFLPDEQYARFRRETTRAYTVHAGTINER